MTNNQKTAVPRPRPTMRDVAALSGVSLKTVSRVVNLEPGVSDDLTARVRQAAEQLDYHPNLTASSLRRSDGKTQTIGLILEDVSNPFEAALHRHIEEVARERGVVVIAGSVDEDEVRERDLAAALVARRVDGLIVMPTGHDQSYLAKEQRSGTPMVFVDRPPTFLDADAVLTANATGARIAIEHLLAHGHRRIGFLGDLPSISTAIERLTGYHDALDRAGISVDSALIRQALTASDQAEVAVAELLAAPDAPTAIFASQNLLTIGVVRALHHMGRQHEIALVGFDDLPLVDLLNPGVTLVLQDVAGLGTAAAEILFRRIDGDTGPSERMILPTTLVPKGSGEILGPYATSSTGTDS